jgi:hypothetical protein
MTINMAGHVSSVLKTCKGTRFAQSGSRGSDGRWSGDPEAPTTHDVNLQPLTEKDVANLGVGAERIQDFRKAYINDGTTGELTPQDEWEFDCEGLVGKRFTVDALDNRPWNNYCKIVMHLNDR